MSDQEPPSPDLCDCGSPNGHPLSCWYVQEMTRWLDQRKDPEAQPIPEQDGLHRKFNVERVDPEAQKRHENCATFVLEPRHDPHARAALLAYADACEVDLPSLAEDLREWVANEKQAEAQSATEVADQGSNRLATNWPERSAFVNSETRSRTGRTMPEQCGGRDPAYPGQTCGLTRGHSQLLGQEDCEFTEPPASSGRSSRVGAPDCWDIGDAEPDEVTHVHDLIADDYYEGDSAHWGKTTSGEWKGYKDGGKVYLDWPELVRRWGPVERKDDCG